MIPNLEATHPPQGVGNVIIAIVIASLCPVSMNFINESLHFTDEGNKVELITAGSVIGPGSIYLNCALSPG